MKNLNTVKPLGAKRWYKEVLNIELPTCYDNINRPDQSDILKLLKEVYEKGVEDATFYHTTLTMKEKP